MHEATSEHQLMPIWLLRFGTIGLVGLAVSVSMGAALIGLFKLWLLMAFFCLLWFQFRGRLPRLAYRTWPSSVKWLGALWLWMIFSAVWSPADPREQWLAFDRYSRLLVLPVAWYVLILTHSHVATLRGFAVGQVVVLLSSYAMLMGWHVPWATTQMPTDAGIVFTSTLEQPIMMSLLALVVFHCSQSVLGTSLSKLKWVLIALTLINILIFGKGRSGYIACGLVMFWMAWHLLPGKKKWLAPLFPTLILSLSLQLSDRMHERWTEVEKDMNRYARSGQLNESDLGSQGQRLNYWARSLDMVQDHPVLGLGLGAWRMHYHQYGGLQSDAPSNPHQQYLLLASEGGLIGLALLLGWLTAIWRDAIGVVHAAALRGVLLIAVVIGLFNCPFYGVGLGEMLLLLFALFLKPASSQA